MFTLVTGGSGSGKSEYAEILIENNIENLNHRYYIATMMPFGEEGEKRIKKHRKQRENRNFHTIEQYLNLEAVEIEKDSDVLLECMSNLVANEIFDKNGSHETTLDSIMAGVEKLKNTAANLVIVTNEIASDGICYDEETMKYIKMLGKVNQELSKRADRVVEVVYTIPIIKKESV